MKDEYKRKTNRITLIIIITILVLFLIVVLLVVDNNEKKEYKLDEFYDVYPDEVRILYSYTKDISCTGAMYFDIELGGGKYLVSNWKINDLLNYTFSYIDKYVVLSGDIDNNNFNRYKNELFENNRFNMNDIKGYQYDEYVYNYEDGKLKRKENKSNSDITYVSDLYGYSYSNKILSVDVNMGYVKDNILYDLSNKELGTYTKDVVKLRDMLKNSSYYRYNYVNDKGTYKIDSVEWVSKI